ncbi:hypothetical protein KH5H1_33330 [Corallococcus caeni]|nr:hypothetical protein KH5H1_33330 [Corallococcus sp. KH5-1]
MSPCVVTRARPVGRSAAPGEKVSRLRSVAACEAGACVGGTCVCGALAGRLAGTVEVVGWNVGVGRFGLMEVMGTGVIGHAGGLFPLGVWHSHS